MIKRATLISFILLLCVSFVPAQIPIATHVQIVKAEDARRYDTALEKLIRSPNSAISRRAMLAAGRIGDEKALPVLIEMLEKAATTESAAMAAFAIGEIESIKAADAILKSLGAGTAATVSGPPKLTDSPRVATRFAGVLQMPVSGPQVTARLLEAAGKIAAANASDPKSKELGAAILSSLETELKKSPPSTEAMRLGLTAVLRARPTGAEETVRKFLAFTDPNVVADALNALARLRAKNANRDARDLLETHVHAIVRANAARVLGAADDKEAVDVLIKAATKDRDSRVRISAIRSLGALRVERSADTLEEHQNSIFKQVVARGGKSTRPPEQNEILEVITAIGNIRAGKPSNNTGGTSTLYETGPTELIVPILNSPETSIARAKISPEFFLFGMLDRIRRNPPTDWRVVSSLAQGIGFVAGFSGDSYGDDLEKWQGEGRKVIQTLLENKETPTMARPDILRAYARFKTDDLGEIAREALQNADVQIRAAAAGVLADLPSSKENVEALNAAFKMDLLKDAKENDAQLAVLDALFKLDKAGALSSVNSALLSQDHLVRKRALDLLKDKQAWKDVPAADLEKAQMMAKMPGIDRVWTYDPKSGTKMGQVLNTDVDYRRALSRKNGTVGAVFTTSKGSFTINLLPEDAPLTVDNFIKLARSGYFNGLEVHRVVPNFVMQDGDPRGDGNGGPGWSIRCEVNMVPYERGAVGMALSGKDTGGSQWFVTHSPQPHLDGGYTVFGRVNETGMKVVDSIVRGDKIISVRVIGK